MAKKTTNTPTSNLSADKAKAVEAAIAQIEKNYGKGSIMALGQQPVEDIPVIPTGCIQLDMALGVGGYPARHCRSPEAWRCGSLHRRRTRF